MSNGISKLLVSLQSDYDEKYKESQQVIQTHVSSFATHMEEMLKHLSWQTFLPSPYVQIDTL